jgi:phosphopantothenoylcysteine synthetase/decarboxylase
LISLNYVVRGVKKTKNRKNNMEPTTTSATSLIMPSPTQLIIGGVALGVGLTAGYGLACWTASLVDAGIEKTGIKERVRRLMSKEEEVEDEVVDESDEDESDEDESDEDESDEDESDEDESDEDESDEDESDKADLKKSAKRAREKATA